MIPHIVPITQSSLLFVSHGVIAYSTWVFLLVGPGFCCTSPASAIIRNIRVADILEMVGDLGLTMEMVADMLWGWSFLLREFIEIL